MHETMFEYKGHIYPTYLRDGNACRFISESALHFCKGKGFDVGCGKWPLAGAVPIDLINGGNAMSLPDEEMDFVFSSHALEHLHNPVEAIEHWKSRIKPGGVLFLYLPHPSQRYWQPANCRKHLHTFYPHDIEQMLRDLGFVDIIRSERDLAWSFSVVGFVPPYDATVAPDAAFRWLATENSDHVHEDPQLSSVFKKFGADAFRRSSAVEKEFWSIINRNNFRGKRCVEIGTYNGLTALVLSRYFDEVVTFDIFPHTIKHTIAEFCGVKNIRFIDVKDNAEKAAIINGLEFDAAYVDGDHLHDTETDFDLVWRCGRVLFHEYWEQQKPVWNLVNNLRADGNVDIDGKLALWTAKPRT